MARDVGWWMGRLRAMSLSEVAHRSLRLARYPVDVVRARTGTYARIPRGFERRLDQWRGPERFYFDHSLVREPADRAVIEAAELACRGSRVVLGLGPLRLPPEPWHYEPRADGWWPRVDSGRVIAAAPPNFDARLTWELNRGHEWVMLARAYAVCGDRRFRARLVSELDSWCRLNPVGIGINWASAMEAAIRIHSLAWVAGLMRGDPDGGLWRSIGRAIFRHAGFVASNLSRFSSANNHLIVELSGLSVGARVLGLSGKLAARHRDALSSLVRELDQQIYVDGVNAEMATHYHIFVLEALLLVAFMERAYGCSRPELERVISRMADYLSALVSDEGALLQSGDNDDGKIISLLADRHVDQIICAAAALAAGCETKPPNSRTAIGQAFDGARLLTGGTASEHVLRAPARSRLFCAGGQVVLRGRRTHAVFDVGPFGFGSLAAHAHCDALAIAVAIDGQRLLVDRGTFRYNGDPRARDRYRMTAAHNTVQVGSREQGDAVGPFLWSRKPRVSLDRCDLAGQEDAVEASHDGFALARYRRTLIRVADVLVVIDSVTGAAADERTVARWHVAPELEVRELWSESPGWIEIGLRGRADVLGWMWAHSPEHAVVWQRTSTSHSDIYAAEAAADSLECELGRGAKRRLVTAIGPGQGGKAGEAIASVIRVGLDRCALSRGDVEALLASLPRRDLRQ